MQRWGLARSGTCAVVDSCLVLENIMILGVLLAEPIGETRTSEKKCRMAKVKRQEVELAFALELSRLWWGVEARLSFEKRSLSELVPLESDDRYILGVVVDGVMMVR
jgi:hypothetical protein